MSFLIILGIIVAIFLMSYIRSRCEKYNTDFENDNWHPEEYDDGTRL